VRQRGKAVEECARSLGVTGASVHVRGGCVKFRDCAGKPHRCFCSGNRIVVPPKLRARLREKRMREWKRVIEFQRPGKAINGIRVAVAYSKRPFLCSS
jgi:hypothetical protein